MWTWSFQIKFTSTGKFMTASINPFQIIMVAHIWIYIPLPLLIYPDHIKYPAIPYICSYLPSLLPLTFMLVRWPPLKIRLDSLYWLLMILVLSMPQIKTRLTIAGWKEDIALGNMMKNMLQKSSAAPRDPIKTRKVITAMGLPGLLQIQELASCKINIICNRDSVYWCVFLPSFVTLPVELVP